MYRGEQLSPTKEANVDDAGGGGVELSSRGWHGRYVFGAARGVCGLSKPSSVATPDIMRGGSESPSATSPTLGRGICDGLIRCPPLKDLSGDLPPALDFGAITSRFAGYWLNETDPREDPIVGGASGLCATPPCKVRPFDDACCVIFAPAALCTHGGGARGGRNGVVDRGGTIDCSGGGALGGGGNATPPLLVLCGT